MPYSRWGILTGGDEYGQGGTGIWANKDSRAGLNELQSALGAVLKNAGINWDSGFDAVNQWKQQHAGQWNQMLNTYLGGNTELINRLKGNAGGQTDPPQGGGGDPTDPPQGGQEAGFDNYDDPTFLNNWKAVNDMLATLDPAEAEKLRAEAKANTTQGQGNRLNYLREKLIAMKKDPGGQKMVWKGPQAGGQTAPPPGTPPPGGPPAPGGNPAPGGGPTIDADVQALNERLERERQAGGGYVGPGGHKPMPEGGFERYPGGSGPIWANPGTDIGKKLEGIGIKPQVGGMGSSANYPYDIPPVPAGDPMQPAGMPPKKKKILGQVYT